MKDNADIVIVGGGIWGLSTAYHVARTGKAGRIVVLERNDELADETTRQAAGQIGQLRSHPVMARAVGYTLDLLTRFKDETGHDPGIRTTGSLHLALNERRMAAFEAQIDAARAHNIDIEVADDALIHRVAPSIDTSQLTGAIFVHGDGYVDARQTALAFAAAARDLGVDVRTGQHVNGLTFDADGRTAGVTTDEGSIDANHVVITAGPWTPLLAEAAGFTPPSHGIRLQQARTAPDPAMPDDHPVVRIPDHSCYLRPEHGGYLFGYFDPEPTALDPRGLSADFRTSDIAPPIDIVEESRRLLGPIMPPVASLPIDEYRQGMVTCTPDGWYVLGPVPNRGGLWVATACAAMGIAGSGAVGNWLAQWMTTGDPGDDLSMMVPDRFGTINDADALREACRQTCASYYSLDGGATYSVGART